MAEGEREDGSWSFCPEAMYTTAMYTTAMYTSAVISLAKVTHVMMCKYKRDSGKPEIINQSHH